MLSRQIKSQTCTPKKSLKRVQFSNKKDGDSTSIKDFLPPIVQNIIVNIPAFTPLKKQPQYLLSPSPIKKDLFSQLLGSQIKHLSPCLSHINSYTSMIMQEQDYCDIESQSNQKQNQKQNKNQQQSHNNNNSDNQNNSDNEDSDSDSENGWDQNGVKKRKRKSTVQIRMLKQELDGQMNWTKEKIVKMAQITGLSQSQVYKWCWDQKKKNVKNKQGNKRKFIRKEYSNNNIRHDDEDKQFNQNKITEYEALEKSVRTKPKVVSMMEEAQMMATQKKINKKLVFG